MQITRRFTIAGTDPFNSVDYEAYHCLTKHHVTGKVLLDMPNCEVPARWSKNARDTLIGKYFRKNGVPSAAVPTDITTDCEIPYWLRPKIAVQDATFGAETSIKQVIHRIVGHWTYVGFLNGYFEPAVSQLPHPVSMSAESNPDQIIRTVREDNARAYYDEMVYMMLHQIGAPNSPQWFNTGLAWAYGIKGPAQGHWFVDLPHNFATIDDRHLLGKMGHDLDYKGACAEFGHNLKPSPDAYSRVQVHACFILGIEDTLLGHNGILSWVEREGRIFKYGSGSGANPSKLRAKGEPLSGGGKSSGLMGWLEAADRSAGAIKSGGTTRRAAKMVCVDLDHPDVLTFINCKVEAEVAVASMVTGSATIAEACQSLIDMVISYGVRSVEEAFAHSNINDGVVEAKMVGVSDNYIHKAIQLGLQGVAQWPAYVFDADFEGRAYQIAPYQNTNHSVRIPSSFYDAVDHNTPWAFLGRVSKESCDGIMSRELESKIALAAWFSGDPGVQFDTIINDWNVTPRDGRINASNPCQPACASVLTPNGISTFGNIEVGDIIWSGSQWTHVVRKVATGIKPVSRYQTTAGSFVGTSQHQVIQEGQRIVAEEAEFIDICVGPSLPKLEIDLNDVMDGWVLGDGTIHHASNDLVVLDVGQNDGDIHTALRSLVRERRTGIGPTAWEVNTSVVAEELPLTFLRRVPARFKYGTWSKMAGFLRGLFSANGSVCGGRITLKASSFQVIADVQEMLSAMGIRSYYTTNKPQTVQFKNGEYDCKQSYDLNITTSRKRFVDLIGFVQEYKQQRAIAAAARPDRPFQKDSYAIMSIEPLGEMPVFDITVEATEHTYWTGGLLVSNCSEFMRPEGSACNLGSINLMQFLVPAANPKAPRGGKLEFDFAAFKHAVNLWQITLDIANTMAHLPDTQTALNVFLYRDTGLGYANLGALLMALAIPYGSPEALALTGLITAFLHGQAHLTSANMAAALGAYPRFWANRDDHLRCVRNHLRAIRDDDEEFEHLRVAPMRINAKDLEKALGAQYPSVNADLSDLWQAAYTAAHRGGLRNAGITVLAPTGTIGIVMDCDTTGVEPLFGLKVFKQLVGGGNMDLTAGSVRLGLERLGYYPQTIDQITAHINETGRIPTVQGRDGSCVVRPEHVSIFATALSDDPNNPAIAWQDHIKTLAAAQTFISGGISKTINMPTTATIDDIKEAFRMGHDFGCKAVALYRDASKLSQPLTIKKSPVIPTTDGTMQVANMATDQVKQEVLTAEDARLFVPSLPGRQRLGWFRNPGFDLAVGCGQGTLYLRTTRYDDGRCAEIWATYSADQGIIQALLSSICKTANVALQHGVPLAAITASWMDANFEPNGPGVDHPYIKNCKSIVNLMAKLLDYHELGSTDSLTIQPQKEAPASAPVASAPVAPEPASSKVVVAVRQCPECGSNKYIPNGAGCMKCAECGTAGGCG